MHTSLEQQDMPEGIDQLWYTWSATGLEALSGGFRVRAATPAFKGALYGDRMMALNPYLLYKLPQGTDRFELAMALDQAPISFTFVKTEQGEKVLVYKVYTGKDGRNRQGVHFVHLLAGLPDSFSVEDAISLWRSKFWQTYDVPADRQGVDLNPLHVESLKECEKALPVLQTDLVTDQRVNTARIYYNLPLVLHAYLAQVKRIGPYTEEPDEQKALQIVESGIENKKHGKFKVTEILDRKRPALPPPEPARPQIYLLAPPDEVAFYITMLTKCLAKPLLAPLTFSTYEHDVKSRTQCLLVGTCPEPALAQIGYAERGTPAYRELSALLPYPPPPEVITINCYTQEATRFEQPQYASDFSDYILQRFFDDRSAAADGYIAYIPPPVTSDPSLLPAPAAFPSQDEEDDDELETLLQDMNQIKRLDVTMFLDTFYHQIIKKDGLSQPYLEGFLSDKDRIKKKFNKKNVRYQFAEHLAKDPTWFERKLMDMFQPIFEQSMHDRSLSNVLSHLVAEVLRVAYDANQRGSADRFLAPIFFIFLALVRNPALVKSDDLRQCLQQANHLLLRNWNLRLQLLQAASRDAEAFPDDIINPLLKGDEEHFAALLNLDLPAKWNRQATLDFLATTSNGMKSQTVDSLETALPSVEMLIVQLYREIRDWGVPRTFYARLVNSGLNGDVKMALIFNTWLQLPLTVAETDDLLLVEETSRLSTRERKLILEQHGFGYLLHGEFSRIALSLYEKVAFAQDGGAAYRKSLLPYLLGIKSGQTTLISEHVLERLLNAARLHQQAGDAIFFFNECEGGLTHGSYIEQYPNLDPLIRLYEAVAGSYNRRMELLHKWLSARSLTPQTAERLISATQFTLGDRALVIQEHAGVFLQNEPLFAIIVRLFAQLAQLDTGNVYFKRVFEFLFDLRLNFRQAESILAAANLKQDSRATLAVWFFKTYNHVLLPFIYQSSTALELFAWLIAHAKLENEEEKLLSSWFSDMLRRQNSVNSKQDIERIILYSSLNGDKKPIQEQRAIDLRASILRAFGNEFLIRCSDSSVVQSQLKCYLRYFDASRFETARNLAPDVAFLEALNRSAFRLNQDVQELMECWLHIKEIISAPSLAYIERNEGRKRLGTTFYGFVKKHNLPREARLPLIRKLAETFCTLHIDSEQPLLALASLLAPFLGNEMFDFFYHMADISRAEFQKKPQSRVLMPYIRLAPNLNYANIDISEQEQQNFTNILWRKLLTEKGFEILEKEAASWDERVLKAWKLHLKMFRTSHVEPRPAGTPPFIQSAQPMQGTAATRAIFPPDHPIQPERPTGLWAWLKLIIEHWLIMQGMRNLLRRPGMRAIAHHYQQHRDVIYSRQKRFRSKRWNRIYLADKFDLLVEQANQANPQQSAEAEAILVRCADLISVVFGHKVFSEDEKKRIDHARQPALHLVDNAGTFVPTHNDQLSQSQIADNWKPKERKKRWRNPFKKSE